MNTNIEDLKRTSIINLADLPSIGSIVARRIKEQIGMLIRHGQLKKTERNEAVYSWASAIRAYTRAQVNALQAYQALVPPPSKPEDLGFKC